VPRVLVTGATGFVGASVVRFALPHGQEVRAPVRASSDRRNLAGLPVEAVEGDVRDAAEDALAWFEERGVVPALPHERIE
jgi:uncharacterized protein YbjT (DUF2867 family)